MSQHKMPLGDKLTIVLMVAMSFFLMCDLYITPSIVLQLAEEYGVAKESIGYVGSAFVLVGAIISIYFGYLTDKFSRKKLLVATVLIGEIPCLLTGIHLFTASFEGFLLMRILTGIGVGGIYPLTFSLLADYCSDKHRAIAAAGIDVAWGIGIMMGPILGGLALNTEYGWRLAFILAALPNFPLAILFWIFARDPQRGSSEAALHDALEEGAVYNHKIKLSDFKLILSNRTNILMLIQGLPGCIPWGVLTFWSITFFVEVRQMTQGNATMVWELFGIGTAIGTVAFAILGDRIFKTNPQWAPVFCGVGVIIGTIPCYLFLNIEFSSLAPLFAFVLFSGIMVACCGPTQKAIFMNINRPEHRGSIFSVNNLADSLGKGIGPAVGSAILAWTGSYSFMLNFAVSCWLLCGAIYIMGYFTIMQDRQSMLDLIEERADSLQTDQKTENLRPLPALDAVAD